MAEQNEEVVVDPITNEGEGGADSETIAVPKSEYDKLNQTIGSLKRENKDLKKPKDPVETPTSNPKSDEALSQANLRIERLALNQGGLTHSEDVELARTTAKKWNMPIEEVLMDEDFKTKLERQRTTRANTEATSNVRGSSKGVSSAKETMEYWLAKGQPPTPEDVPNKTVRQKIIGEILSANRNNKTLKYYND